MGDRIAQIEARLQAAKDRVCPSCGARPMQPCWGNGPMAQYHQPRGEGPSRDDIRYLLDELAKARAACAAYERVWWMAERYAEGGGSGGPEQRDLDEARAEIDGEGGDRG